MSETFHEVGSFELSGVELDSVFEVGDKQQVQVHADATGSILAKLGGGKPLLHHVLLFSIYVSDNKQSTPFNLSELVTSSQTMETISNFLQLTIELVQQDTDRKFDPMFHEITTDKSFANIGAILRAFNDKTLTEYLELCWDILTASNTRT